MRFWWTRESASYETFLEIVAIKFCVPNHGRRSEYAVVRARPSLTPKSGVSASGIPPAQVQKISAVSINGRLPNPEKRRIGSPPFIPPGKPGNFLHPPARKKRGPPPCAPRGWCSGGLGGVRRCLRQRSDYVAPKNAPPFKKNKTFFEGGGGCGLKQAKRKARVRTQPSEAVIGASKTQTPTARQHPKKATSQGGFKWT